MSDRPRRKLIEVALPLEAIDVACQADKNRKTGSIRNLHKWFAPMPVPAWRALLFAALVDDPEDAGERRRLWDIIERLVSSGADPPPPAALRDAIAELEHCEPGGLPTVVDPFCGGGSTLVEAQRLGLPSRGSDLNPVAALVSRTLSDLVPRALAEARDSVWPNFDGIGPPSIGDLQKEIVRWAGVVGDRAEARVRDLYPPLPDEQIPYAWLWTRNAPCPNPACRLRTPLVNSWRLSAKAGDFVFARPIVVGDGVAFELTTEESKTHPEVKTGRAQFSCVRCSEALNASYLRQVAGELGVQLLAIAATSGGSRVYLPPTPEQEAALSLPSTEDSFLRVPIAEGALGIQVPLWGLKEQRDLYTSRQATVLTVFADEVSRVVDEARAEGVPPACATAIATVLGLAVSRLAMHNSMQVKWFTRNGPSKADPALREPNLPLVWTFTETNPFGGSVGDWLQVVQTSVRALSFVSADARPAEVVTKDARHAADSMPVGGSLVATDPPYFGHIGYADLSDYFYVWLRRSLRGVHPDLFETLAAPRDGELVANPNRHEGDQLAAQQHFVDGYTRAFKSLSRAQHPNIPMLIVYAHREFEGAHGWEAMLTAIVTSGLQLVGTWPIEASRANRLRNVRSNALASYVVLVCRPRSDTAALATRKEFTGALRTELSEALQQLQSSSIAPVDLAQAAIGPGMSIFSRYSKVVEADGSPMEVRTALSLISEARDQLLAEQEADFDGDTRWCVAWFQEHGMNEGPFGVAEALSRAQNTAINGLEEAGVVHSGAGKVRLLDRSELEATWNPAEDARLTVWEVTQHMIARHHAEGEEAAAGLLRQVGGLAEAVRELAYRLFSICERKGWAQEALAYNALVTAWPEITRLAAQAAEVASAGEQETMEV